MRSRLFVFALLAVLAAPTAVTAAPETPLPGPDQTLPVDPAVRIGHLANGLTYYIRANHKPENRAELRLVVNAGSVLETEGQRGLAHFVEHMAFNGTEHFAHNELIDFLESIGTKFGADLNAYTGFDQTVYMLEIPTDKAGLLDDGVLVLSDWADRITFAPDEVQKERGVVMEEWRLGRGARERIRKIQWPVLLKGSRYAERLPIGLPEVIENAPVDTIRSFYDSWYRPPLIAVVAVGTFDPDSMETLIRTHFEPIPPPPEKVQRPYYDVPPNPRMLASAATDTEMPYTQVSIVFKRPVEEQGKVRDYRRDLVTTLFSSMLNARLAEITKKPDAPFLFAGTGSGSFVRTLDMYQAFAVAPEGGVTRALSSLMTEIARVRAHGFTAGELDRAKARFLAGMERAYNERDKTESNSYVSEYVDNYLEQEPIPGIDYEYDLAKGLTGEITLDEVQGSIDRLVHEGNTVILASGPDKAGVVMPSADSLVAAARTAEASAPAAYVDSLAAQALLPRPPAAGQVVKREEHPDLGVTAITFANGVEVWMKPTDFKNDEVLFGAQAPGGTCLADSADYPSADLATAYLNEAGAGGFTPTDLGKLLSGKIASASPFLQTYSEGLRGHATPADLETALQLLYLELTAPNDRPEAFGVLIAKYRELVQNRLADPRAQFADELMRVNYSNSYMFQPTTPEYLERADREKALAFYKARAAEASSFRYYFVGSFDPARVETLAARYLGSLPPSPDKPHLEGRDVHFPSGAVEKTVYAGTDPKSSTAITWPALTGNDELEMYLLRIAGDVLEIRLREKLREELGATYSVSVSGSYLLPYKGYATTSVSFGSSPENAAKMRQTVFDEVARFKAGGPTPEEVDKVKELELRSLQKGLEQNGYWLGSFLTVDILGWEPSVILHRRERIDKITAESLKDVMSRYYAEDNYTVVTLMPESEKPSGDGTAK
jgi:zinc protease